MQQQGENYIKFEDEDGNPLYFRVNSSAGMIPVRIDGVEVLGEDEDGHSKVSIDYQIDTEHPNCPDLDSIDPKETVMIMTTLKERIPEMVTKMLEEAHSKEKGE